MDKEPEKPKRKRKQPPPFDIILESERDNRVGMSLFRPVESEVTLTANTRFAVIPGDKGRGWRLRVYPDAPDNN